MDEKLKQLTALLSKLPEEDKKLASELLKGVAPSNAPTSGGEKVDLPATAESSGTKTNISASPQSDAIKAGLTNPKIDAIELRAFADMEAARRSKSSNRPMVQSSTRPNDPNDNKFRKEVYRELGISDPLSENRSAFDLNRLDAKAAAIGKSREEYESMPRLERMKLESAGAAAEQERRQGIRDSVALPFNSQFLKDKEKFEAPFKQQGLPAPGADRTGYEEGNRNIFKDAQGRLEDPATLKARLIKEGMNPNDATIAAGQRSRDMFAPPNAKKDGFGMQGGQAGAVMAVAPESRMDVMQQLKDARKDNLQALVEARRNNPFRKEVGTVTKIEAPDGTVIAQRGEGEVRTDRAGNTVDAPGRMNFLNGASNLKDALTTYNNADVAKRPNVPVVYEGTNEPSMTGSGASRRQETVSAPAPTVTNAPEGGRIVRGIYGTAFSGEAAKTAALVQERRDQGIPIKPEDKLYMKEGGVPAGFQRNPDGKVVATRPDPIKEQLAKNQQDGLDKAADEELKRRQATKKKGVA
jgi:hypothetical protein